MRRTCPPPHARHTQGPHISASPAHTCQAQHNQWVSLPCAQTTSTHAGLLAPMHTQQPCIRDCLHPLHTKKHSNTNTKATCIPRHDSQNLNHYVLKNDWGGGGGGGGHLHPLGLHATCTAQACEQYKQATLWHVRGCTGLCRSTNTAPHQQNTPSPPPPPNTTTTPHHHLPTPPPPSTPHIPHTPNTTS